MSSSSDDITIVQDILNGHGPDGGCANGFDSDFYPDHGWLMDDDSSSQLKIKTNSTPYEHPPLPTGPSLIDDNPFGRGCGVVFAINYDQDKNSNRGSLVDGVSSSSHQVRPFPTPSTNCALPLLRIPDLNDSSSGRGAGGVFANNYDQDKNSDHGSLVDADSSSQFQIKPTPYEHPIPLPTGPLLKDDRATGCGPGCFCANCGGPGFSGQNFNPDRRYGSSSSQKRPYPTPYNHSTPQDLSIRPSVRENYPSLERRRQDENKPEVLNKKLQVNMPESGRGAGGVFANNYDQDKNSNRGSFVDGVSSSSHLMKTFRTPSTSTNCAVPLFRLPDLRDDHPSRSEGAEENGWDCSVCTYRNTAEALKCLVCDACRATLTREENEKELIEKDLKKNIVKLLKFYPKEKVLEKVNSIINEERNSTFPTKTPLSPNTRKKSEGKPKKLKSENLEIWDAEFEEKDDYHTLLALNDVKLVSNVEKFECPVCFLDVEVGEGATLQECLHSFCKECLAGAVQFSETVVVKCPFRNDEYSCEFHLQEREVKALVTPEAYERHLQRSMALAESQAQDSFHCKTPDCRGWCLFEDNVNTFFCPVCRHTNCLTCGAIHEGINCRQYQEDVAFKCDTSEEARKTRAHLQSMVDNGEAMRCPQCRVFVMRKWGCDWLKCSMCHTEICWVTKGPRWGPGGSGDTSGGCKCRVNGRKCHRKCSNCH